MTREEVFELNKKYQLSGETKERLKSYGLNYRISAKRTSYSCYPLCYLVQIFYGNDIENSEYEIIDFIEVRDRIDNVFDYCVESILYRFIGRLGKCKRSLS